MPIDEQRLIKLQQLLKMLSDSITREEFTTSFENVVKSILELKKNNKIELAKFQEAFNKLSNQFKSDSSSNISDVKIQVAELGNQIKDDLKKNLKTINEKLNNIPPGIPGKDADEQKIVKEVLKQIPPQIEPLLDDGEEIVAKINELPTDNDDKKIDYSHIKNGPKPSGSGQSSPIGLPSVRGVSAGTNIAVDNDPTFAGYKRVTLNIPVQPTAPDDPVENMLWIDNS